MSSSFLVSLLFGLAMFRESIGQGQSATSVQLPIRDINILVLTDVHSWVMGHGRHNSNLNADYGHVLSFYERLKLKCAEQGKDLFFVNNGDVVDGTGLSTYPPDSILPIVKMMPYDALTIGNHELYHEVSVRYMQNSSYFDFWDGRYLTSNTVDVETNDPLGDYFTFLRGTETGYTILAFGFLYNMVNNCAITKVLKVQDVVESDWFFNVLSGLNGDFDAIMVLAHMDAEDELVRVILYKIRVICGDRMPVQFLTGHSHLRKFNVTDGFSSSFEAGHYLDTVGYISFDLPNADAFEMSFHHEFIDANITLMTNLLGEENLMTTNGKALSQKINETETKLGILNVIGCNVPITYYLKHSIDKTDSLWALFLNKVVPKYLFKEGNGNQIFIANTGAWRYNLYKGNVTVNDMISVSPYNDTLCTVGDNILGSDFLQAFGTPNFVNSTKFGELPQFAVAGTVEPDKTYKVYSITFDCDFVSQKLTEASNRSFVPMVLERPTTTTLWQSFITTEWSCPEPDERNWKDALEEFFSEFTVLKIIAFVLTFFIIIIYGWMFICRRDRRRVIDDLSFFDDSIIGEISSDDEESQDNSQSKLAKEAKMRGASYHSVKDQEYV